jgi:hypothetical protein
VRRRRLPLRDRPWDGHGDPVRTVGIDLVRHAAGYVACLPRDAPRTGGSMRNAHSPRSTPRARSCCGSSVTLVRNHAPRLRLRVVPRLTLVGLRFGTVGVGGE